MPANRPNLRPPAGGLLMVNPPAPRRLLAIIALAVLLISAAVPAVSAEDFPITHEISYSSLESDGIGLSATGGGGTGGHKMLVINQLEHMSNLKTLVVTIPHRPGAVNTEKLSGSTEFTLKDGYFQSSPVVAEGTISYNLLYSGDQVSDIRIWFDFSNFNYPGIGSKSLYISYNVAELNGLDLSSTKMPSAGYPTLEGNVIALRQHYASSGTCYIAGDYVWNYGDNFDHTIIVDYDSPFYNISVQKYNYLSTVTIYDIENVFYNVTGISDIDVEIGDYAVTPPFTVSVIAPSGDVYAYDYLTPPTPELGEAAQVTIYVQNSQTGALLANANLAILAAAGGTETEILNTTLPGGTATYTLQPTGGGIPNPDYYRAVATVPGFSQIIENHSFTLTGPHDVIIEMRPDSGGPLDPDRAYLEFYVRDIHANPISSASVQCDGRIKTTNSQGYAVFEVSKNATYPYVAKKSGYVTIEGTATVADGPRYVANVVLGPGTVPTYTPTLGPGETPGGPGATPTPDTRTNEQKGQAIIDLIADFAEPIAILAILATIFGLMKMMTPGRR